VHEDRFGLPVSTGSETAFEHYCSALDLVLAGQDGAVGLLRQALESDEQFALGWALLGLQQRASGDIQGGSASLERAVALSERLTGREQSHLGVLQRFAAGDVVGTEAALDAHLREWPRDAVIVMQAHFLYNLFDSRPGRDRRQLALDEQVASFYGEDWFMLAELAFSAEENGQYERARDLAEQSLVGHPFNYWAAHALAHVYLETDNFETGSSWLRDWLSQWQQPSPAACHLTWHLALLKLAADDTPSVVSLLADIIDFTGRSMAVLYDGASLSWRLALDGVTVALPWEQLAKLPDRPGFTFGNAHHALALAGSGDTAALLDYSESLDRLAAAGHPTARRCADFARAVQDLTVAKNIEAADRLAALWPEFRSFGGSRAQTEVFEDTAIAASERAGRLDTAGVLLRSRLARRPSRRDSRWLARLG
jgi:hypothetical protein